MEEEAHVALVEHVVDHFLVEFRAECGGGESLCFATGEDGRSVGHGKGRNLAPDGADVGCAASVEALAFVEDAAAHGVALHVVVVAVHEAVLLFEFFGSEFGVCSSVAFLEVFTDFGEGFFALVLVVVAGFGNGVGGLVALVLYLLTELFVVDFVVVFALHVGAEFLGEFLLELTHGLDGFVGGLEGFEECAFGHFVHFAFHHHDVFFRCAYHDVHVGVLELFESGVDDVFAVDACHADLRDGAFEGYVAGSECC